MEKLECLWGGGLGLGVCVCVCVCVCVAGEGGSWGSKALRGLQGSLLKGKRPGLGTLRT